MIQRPPLLGVLIQAYKHMLVWLVDCSHRRAGWILMGALLLSAVCLSFTASSLHLDTDTTKMLDQNLPYRQQEIELERAFPQLNDIIVVVIESDTAERADEAADEMARRLQESPDSYQSIYQPGKGTFFEKNGLLYLDIDDLWKVDERLTAAEPFLGSLARDPSLRGLFSVLERAFDEPLNSANQELLTKIFDGISDIIDDQMSGNASSPFWRKELLDDAIEPKDIYRSFILVKPRLDFTSYQVGGGGLANIRNLATQLETNGKHGIRIRLTGKVALSDDELGAVPQGAGLATLFSFTLVFLILFTGLRSVRLISSILLTLIMGLAWNAGFATLVIGHVNVISICFPVLFIGLGVDFGIQFGMRYREELERGTSHSDALQHAALGVGPSLTLAAITAAISFFSFVPTGYKGLAELGLISGGGMFIALIANLTLLPALLSIFPLRLPLKREKNGTVWWLGSWMVGHKRITLSVTLITLLAACFLLPFAQFDFNPLHMKDPKLESVGTFLDLLGDPDTTPYTISVLTTDLGEAENLGTRLEQLEEVDKTITLASFVPSHQDEKLAIIDEMNLVLQPVTMPSEIRSSPTIEEQIETIEAFQHRISQPHNFKIGDQLLGGMERLDRALNRLKTTSGWPTATLQELHNRLLADLPKNLDRLRNLLSATPITLEDLPENLRSQYLSSNGKARVEVYPNRNLSDNEPLRQFVRAVQSVAPHATDTPVALLEGGNVVLEAVIHATIISLIGAIVVLLAALARIRDAILVLIPLMMATVLTVASTVLFEVPLNLANIIAIPLLFGLGIAFGIYLMLRKRSGLDFDTLFHSSTPRAVLFSALTTMASFGTLMFIDHRGTASIGLLLTIALTAALVCTLVVLPAIVAELEAREA